MFVLRDKKLRARLTSAWKKRMAKRGLPRTRRVTLRKLHPLFWICLISILLVPASAVLATNGANLAEKIARLTLFTTTLGGLLYAILSLALINGRSLAILSNTPVADKLALRHTLLGLIPAFVIACIMITAVGVTAHGELFLDIYPTWRTVFITYIAVLLGFASAQIIGLWVSPIWIGLGSIATAFITLVFGWIPAMQTALIEASPWLENMLPPGWVISTLARAGEATYPWIKLAMAISLAGYVGWIWKNILSSWRCPRPSWEDDEIDLKGYLEELEADDRNTDEDVRSGASRHFSNILKHKAALPQENGWLERLFLSLLGNRQKKIILATGVPRLTRSLYFGLIIVAAFSILRIIYPTDFWAAGVIHVICLLGMVCGMLKVLPISTSSRVYTSRVNLNMQTVAPISTLVPVRIQDILRMQLAEWLPRAIISLPFAVALLLYFRWYQVVQHLDWIHLRHALYQAAFFLAAFPAIGFSCAVFLGTDASNWRSGRLIHTLALLFLLIPHKLLILIAVLFLPLHTTPKWLFIFAVAMLFSSLLLIALTIHHYSSPKTETSYPVADE